jgi:hypothetical protein
MYVLILTKKGLGHILGYFLTNSSGHPDGIVYIAAESIDKKSTTRSFGRVALHPPRDQKVIGSNPAAGEQGF